MSAVIAAFVLALAPQAQPAFAQQNLHPPQASKPASLADEAALFKKVEELAFTMGADASGTRHAVRSRSRHAGSDEVPLQLSSGLSASNIQIQVDPSGKSEEMSFDVLGGCISTRRLLNRYPGLLVLHVPLDPAARSMVGQTIGGSLAVFIMTPGPGPCATEIRIQTIESARAQHLLR